MLAKKVLLGTVHPQRALSGMHMKTAKISLKASRSGTKVPSFRRSRALEMQVLFFEHLDCWSAQCLERDIAAQAKTLEDLYSEIERVLVAHLSVAKELGQEPFKGIAPAPKKYWDLFKKSHICITRPPAMMKRRKLTQPRIHSAIRVAERVSA
jgi:hypothetical protein